MYTILKASQKRNRGREKKKKGSHLGRSAPSRFAKRLTQKLTQKAVPRYQLLKKTRREKAERSQPEGGLLETGAMCYRRNMW